MKLKPIFFLFVVLIGVFVSTTPAYAITGQDLFWSLKSTIYDYTNTSTPLEYKDVESSFSYDAGSNVFSGITIYVDNGEQVDYTLILADGSTLTGTLNVTQNYVGLFWPFSLKCQQTIKQNEYTDYDYNELYTIKSIPYIITYGIGTDLSHGHILNLNGELQDVYGINNRTYTSDGKLTASQEINLYSQYIKHISGTVTGGKVTIVTYTQNVPQLQTGIGNTAVYQEQGGTDTLHAAADLVATLLNFVVQVIGILMMMADWFIFIFIENFWLVLITYVCLTAALSVHNANGDIFKAGGKFIEYQLALVNFIIWFIRAIIEIFTMIINAIKPT